MAGGVDAGRAHFAAKRWRAAYDCLTPSAVDPEDLERLATAAYLLDLLPEYYAALERAYARYLADERVLDAVRCARWIGLMRMKNGDIGQGTGWIARAQRLVEEYRIDGADLGYLRFPEMFAHEADGELELARQVADEVAQIGRRFGDADLVALAVHSEGLQLIELGRVQDGLRRLDETMVAVTADELSPIVNGIVYCAVIGGCRAAYEVPRAAEWTEAMRRWCDAQPDMQMFRGECRLHRAELLELRGAWRDALAELDWVSTSSGLLADACYRRAEVLRLQGAYDAAEAAYHEASELGREPQPGLALIRLARGSTQAAATMIRLALAAARDPARRLDLLPAAVEVLVATDDVEGARQAAAEIADLAKRFGTRLLSALAGEAAGTVALADGEPDTALAILRGVAAEWQELAAPYALARTRTLVGLALRTLGDMESADLEMAAARATFARLGAVADLARVDRSRSDDSQGPTELTTREMEVLRLVAGGATNRSIAEQLILSERTVDRHVSNILAKLGVSSRTAAAAYAFERQLI